MDTVVLVLMLLIAFNFLLKQTFWKTVAVGIIATVAALFAGLMWPYAIESMKPGATALTVIPLRPSSRAIVLVIPIRPAFVAT